MLPVSEGRPYRSELPTKAEVADSDNEDESNVDGEKRAAAFLVHSAAADPVFQADLTLKETRDRLAPSVVEN